MLSMSMKKDNFNKNKNHEIGVDLRPKKLLRKSSQKTKKAIFQQYKC